MSEYPDFHSSLISLPLKVNPFLCADIVVPNNLRERTFVIIYSFSCPINPPPSIPNHQMSHALLKKQTVQALEIRCGVDRSSRFVILVQGGSEGTVASETAALLMA